MTNTLTNTESVAQDSSEPTNDAIAPSRMNGNRIVQFEAPTKRMISVSFFRVAALMRIVVAVSMMATTTMPPASTTVTTVARFNNDYTDAKFCC